MTSSRAATRGAMFLPVVVAGARKASWSSISSAIERRDILGQAVAVGRVVGDMDLADAGDLRGRLGDAADALAGDEQMDLAELRRGGDGGERGVLDLAAFMLDREPASSCHHSQSLELADQLVDRADLDAGLALGGSTTFSVVSRGAVSTP